MSLINDVINYFTTLINNGGYFAGFLLVLLESFLPILPLGAFVALNVNAFGFLEGILLSWIATTIGSFLTYLIFYYVSNKSIYKLLSEKTIVKLDQKKEKFKNIKLTNLVLLITVPFAPSCFINLLAGIAGIAKEKYLIALLIGKSFMITFWGYIGKSLIDSLTNIKALIYIIATLIIAYLVTKIISKKLDIE